MYSVTLIIKIFMFVPWKRKIKFFFFKNFLKIFFYSFFLFFHNLQKNWFFKILIKKKKQIFNLLKSALRYKLYKHQFVLKKTFFLLTCFKKENMLIKKKCFLKFLENFFFNKIFKYIFFNWGSLVFIKFFKKKLLNLKWFIY